MSSFPPLEKRQRILRDIEDRMGPANGFIENNLQVEFITLYGIHVKVGSKFPARYIDMGGKTPEYETYTLMPARLEETLEPTATSVLVEGKEYIVRSDVFLEADLSGLGELKVVEKNYDLESGYKLKANIVGDKLYPKLRKARGLERIATQKRIYNPHQLPYMYGPITKVWPVIVATYTSETRGKDTLAEEFKKSILAGSYDDDIDQVILSDEQLFHDEDFEFLNSLEDEE